MEWVLLAGLSLFFLYAGGSKLVDTQAFAESIGQYRLVTGMPAWWGALYLPWIECLAALFLWIRPWRAAALWILAGLILVFQGALLSALIRGLDISCGCFGKGTDSSVLLSFMRNLILLAPVGWLLFSSRRR